MTQSSAAWRQLAEPESGRYAGLVQGADEAPADFRRGIHFVGHDGDACGQSGFTQGGEDGGEGGPGVIGPGPELARLPAGCGEMIAWLRGAILEKHPNRVIVDVGGVGYDVHVPLSTYYDLGEPGAPVVLRVHTHVREDLIALYGFATIFELQVFERLIGISGIGPKVALAVLSGIDPVELASAVQRGDVARLTAVPGVGKKTAERIVLELRDRLAKLGIEAAAGVAPASPREALREDLLSALTNLGYHRPLAEKALDTVLRKEAEPSFEHALKEALRELAR